VTERAMLEMDGDAGLVMVDGDAAGKIDAGFV
jgi:hypothetical protein